MEFEALLKSAGAEDLLHLKPVYSGWLKKRNKNQKLQNRYCILHEGALFYFDDCDSKRAKGGFKLAGYGIFEAEGMAKQFIMKHQNDQHDHVRSYFFVAGSLRERQEWINHLLTIINTSSHSVNNCNNCVDEDDEDDNVLNEIKDDVGICSEFDDEHYTKINLSEVKLQGPVNVPISYLPMQRKPIPLPRKSLSKFNSVPNVYTAEPTKELPVKAIGCDELYGDIYEYKKTDDDSVYEKMNFNIDINQHENTNCSVDDNTFIKIYETMGPVTGVDEIEYENMTGTKEAVYDHPRDNIYVAPITATETLSPEDRSLLAPPVPMRQGSLKDSTKKLQDHIILPTSAMITNIDRGECAGLLQQVGTLGTYIVRTGRKNKKDVLSVLTGTIMVKHYIIFENDNRMYLEANEPKFNFLTELVRYYYLHELPTCGIFLTQPYK